jgi:RNA polymerase sigma-70 factor, ECF subfamily
MTVASLETASPNTAPSPQDIALAYQNLRQTLLGFLRKKVSDNTVAEDLLHEVFLKALNAIERGDSPTNLNGWLYSIAKNSVVDYYRTKRPTDPLPDELIAPESDDDLTEQDLARCLKPLTESLPPMYRNTLLAADFEGQTLQLIADRESLSLSAIKSRASRGRQMLKQSLLACCQVDVSQSGQVVDFHANNMVQKNDKPSCCGT